MTVLVTGANGFAGSALSTELSRHVNSVVSVARTENKDLPPGARSIGDIGNSADLNDIHDGVVTRLLDAISGAIGQCSFTVPFSESLRRLAAKAIGPEEETRRITDQLTITPKNVMTILTRQPPPCIAAGTERTVADYRQRNNG